MITIQTYAKELKHKNGNFTEHPFALLKFELKQIDKDYYFKYLFSCANKKDQFSYSKAKEILAINESKYDTLVNITNEDYLLPIPKKSYVLRNGLLKFKTDKKNIILFLNHIYKERKYFYKMIFTRCSDDIELLTRILNSINHELKYNKENNK